MLNALITWISRFFLKRKVIREVEAIGDFVVTGFEFLPYDPDAPNEMNIVPEDGYAHARQYCSCGPEVNNITTNGVTTLTIKHRDMAENL